MKSHYCEDCKRISMSIASCALCGMRVCGRCRSRGTKGAKGFGVCMPKRHYAPAHATKVNSKERIEK